jgi:3-deoxy-D-manno-octulosonic-acid transferase
VYVLAQSDRHAARFHRLGVPMDRIRVIGDLKASAERAILEPGAAPRVPFGARPALVFGSLRPGEERTARILAETLQTYRRRAAEPARDRAAGERGSAASLGGFSGRGRSVLVVAPRHRETEGSVRRELEGAGFEVSVRDETSRTGSTLHAWIDSVAARPGPRAGLLATRGELPEAYAHAWGAVVGGTFAPYGGHNVWEPAARACPVLVGPHHGDVETAVDALRAEGGGVAIADEAHLVRAVEGWLSDQDLEIRGRAAARAAAAAAGAVERGMAAVDDWELGP